MAPKLNLASRCIDLLLWTFLHFDFLWHSQNQLPTFKKRGVYIQEDIFSDSLGIKIIKRHDVSYYDDFT